MNALRTFWRLCCTAHDWLEWVLGVSAATFGLVAGVAFTLLGLGIAIMGLVHDPGWFRYPSPLLFWLAQIVGSPVVAFLSARGMRKLWRTRPVSRRLR